jgi:uncharacterized protein YbcI
MKDSVLASTISDEMAQIHFDSYGLNVGKAKSYIFEDLIVSVIDIELLPAEQILADDGQGDLVQARRPQYEEAIGASFKAAVERTTGRTVASFVSETHIDPHFTVELFRLSAYEGGVTR